MSELSNPALIGALIDAQRRHKSVRIVPPAGENSVASTILGFDYYESTLLLDNFAPQISRSDTESMKHCAFWLQLPHQDHFLTLYCLLESHLYELYTLKILSYEFTSNRRWYPRIHFDPRRGPILSLTPPHALPVDGWIKNLSVRGAQVEIYGEDIREQLAGQARCDCRIKFNELFTVDCTAAIRQLAFKRSPACHSSLRLVFPQLSPVVFRQLENFIEALHVN